MHLQAQDQRAGRVVRRPRAHGRSGGGAGAAEAGEDAGPRERGARHREPRAHLQAADSEPQDARAHLGAQPRLPRGDGAEGRREARADAGAARGGRAGAAEGRDPPAARARRRAAVVGARRRQPAPRSEDEGVRLVDRPAGVLRPRVHLPPERVGPRQVGLDAAVWGDAARAAHRAAGGSGGRFVQGRPQPPAAAADDAGAADRRAAARARRPEDLGEVGAAGVQQVPARRPPVRACPAVRPRGSPLCPHRHPRSDAPPAPPPSTGSTRSSARRSAGCGARSSRPRSSSSASSSRPPSSRSRRIC